jgi:DNA-3-methyladenine glycosylase
MSRQKVTSSHARLTATQSSRALSSHYFQSEDVVFLAQDLIGKILISQINGERTGGRIVETEAYRGPDDAACHAYLGRRTARNEIMYGPGGYAYIYVCYGIHHLFNIVTGPIHKAHAVLIRGLEPVEGLEYMLRRRRLERLTPQVARGPGVLSEAMGLHSKLSGHCLTDPQGSIYLSKGYVSRQEKIKASPRIGISNSGEAVHYPWRFYIAGNPFVSVFRA